MDWDAKQNFEDDELQYIADQIKDGYTNGITPYGSTWSIEVNFNYPDEDE